MRERLEPFPIDGYGDQIGEVEMAERLSHRDFSPGIYEYDTGTNQHAKTAQSVLNNNQIKS
jgi:hypothetical protein